jgi:hypothetical protein
MARQAGFWDYEEHLARRTKGGDPLVTLADVNRPGFVGGSKG